MEKNSATGSDDQSGSVGSPGEKASEERPQEELSGANTSTKKAIRGNPSPEEELVDAGSSLTPASQDTASTAELTDIAPANGLPAPSGTVKNPAAVSLGRLGGLKGGKARAEALTKRERSEAARKAARARWRKKEQTK
jgi:hypothetical protein